MKKLVLLAVVAAFTATVIGCGPAPTTGGAKPSGSAPAATSEKK